MFIPLFIFAINAFISANTTWRVSNVFVSVLIYSIMALWLTDQFSFRASLPGFIFKTLKNLVMPTSYFKLPAIWYKERQKSHTQTIKRVIHGMLISIPCLIFLVAILSSADVIFSNVFFDFFNQIVSVGSFSTLVRIILGMIVGLYLFGMFYYVNDERRKDVDVRNIKHRRGDLIILNILFISTLMVYTVFVIIQFRYLFAGAGNLPYGLTFESYARNGFFELMFLSAINLAFILISVWITRQQFGLGAKITKASCLYMCVVTAVLLTSSFYRMWLHGSDDGLTRMRFLVFGFLIFKAIGLIATFFYVVKPNFNILAVYCVIALVYYMGLNLVPMDAIVARSQINRYFTTGRSGIAYVTSLSPDAGREISRLLSSDNGYTLERVARYYDRTNLGIRGWRQWNLSSERFRSLRITVQNTNPHLFYIQDSPVEYRELEQRYSRPNTR